MAFMGVIVYVLCRKLPAEGKKSSREQSLRMVEPTRHTVWLHPSGFVTPEDDNETHIHVRMSKWNKRSIAQSER